VSYLSRIQFGIPEITEENATGLVKFLYDDIKYVLKVPIVNFVFRTLAHYERFLQVAWTEVRPNMLTFNMEEAASDLRYPQTSFHPPKIEWERYYTTETIERIQKTIFTFNYVNTKLLLITTAWEESLGHRPILGSKENKGFITPGIIKELPPVHLVNIPEASVSVQQLLFDIIHKKKGYDAASDYRALAKFPTFLNISWSYIKPHIGSNEYTLLSKNIREKARKNVHDNMPYPVTISPESLYSLYSPKNIAGIMGVVTMFSSFIADLIIDGEYLRSFFDEDSSLIISDFQR
jgi:hypothetical protein